MKTSTKNVIITGIFALICSVISILGTKEYMNIKQKQKQEQTQSQKQDQEQTQNQSITVIIDGKEVSYVAQDVEALNNKISDLETENSKLESNNKFLNNKIKEISSIPNVNLGDYELIIDGIAKNINSKNSIIEYDKHIYIRDNVVSFINSDINVDNQNNKIIVGNIFGETYLLMKTCPPYQKSDNQYYREPDTFRMAGKVYTNGFSMQDGSFALFNLSGGYSSLNFILGHIDETTMIDGIFNIYLDDQLVQTIEIGCDDIPQTYNISLNNAIQMRIEKVDTTQTVQMGEWYGFADVILQ